MYARKTSSAVTPMYRRRNRLSARRHGPERPAASNASSDDAGTNGVDSGLDPIVDLELHQDVRDVILHCLRTDVKLRCDDGVVLAVRDQLQDLDLAVAQLCADRVGDLRLRA